MKEQILKKNGWGSNYCIIAESNNRKEVVEKRDFSHPEWTWHLEKS